MKMVGMYMRSVIYDGLQGISMGPFTRGLKWTPDEVELLLVDVRKSLFDISTHSYLPFHIYYGQKPLDGWVVVGIRMPCYAIWWGDFVAH
jgi:hypothetical protein